MATRVASLSDLDLRSGSVLFDQWRIERELGRGGFGVVVEAEELTLRERQAVKVLDPAMVARADLLERFRREVKATRKLVHPRIVRVFDYRENLPEGLALFSMELVKGCSVQLLLAASREKGEPASVPLALTILFQVLEALEAAHAQGVIHRDVTPANILLAGGTAEELLLDPSRDPQVKLVDFGIAGALERSELSQKSRVLGTAAYVAPEVLDPHVEVTPAADVYGAGAVFYELLTGRAPLGRFPDPSRVRSGLAPRVDALALSLLEAEAAARPIATSAKQQADAALLGEARDRDEERRRIARAMRSAAEERGAQQRREQQAEERRGSEDESRRRVGSAVREAEGRRREAAARSTTEENPTSRPARGVPPPPPVAAPRPPAPMPPPAPRPAPMPPLRVAPAAPAYDDEAAPGKGEPAGFWIRSLAFHLDLLPLFILNAVAALVGYWVDQGLGWWGLGGLPSHWEEGAMGAVCLAYYQFFWARWGATPGKKALRLKIVREHGKAPLGWKTALIRMSGYLVGGMFAAVFFSFVTMALDSDGVSLRSDFDPVVVVGILLLVLFISTAGFLPIAFGAQKRGLHDRLARTRVLKLG